MPRVVEPSNNDIYLGIDPGMGGGMAWLGLLTQAIPMPDTERDIWTQISYLGANGGIQPTADFAVIEKVSGYIGQAQPGSAMFKFGQSYGSLRMALIAANIPFEEVTPQKWQKGLGIVPRKRDESKGSWKNRLKARAQQLFPSAKVTLQTADALLIAEYCRRMRQGKL